MTGPAAAGPVNLPSGDDAKVGGRELRALVGVAEPDGAQAGHELLGLGQRDVASHDGPAGLDQPAQRGSEFLECAVDRRGADSGDGRDVHHPTLQDGDFAQRGVDAVLDRADLGGDFIGGILDQLSAHDCSFPGAARRSGCRTDLKAGALLPVQSRETFEPGEVHARRERRSDRDRRDPEQPLADTHLIPGVAPCRERQLQEGPD
jgi:hypothetical protein